MLKRHFVDAEMAGKWNLMMGAKIKKMLMRIVEERTNEKR